MLPDGALFVALSSYEHGRTKETMLQGVAFRPRGAGPGEPAPAPDGAVPRTTTVEAAIAREPDHAEALAAVLVEALRPVVEAAPAVAVAAVNALTKSVLARAEVAATEADA